MRNKTAVILGLCVFCLIVVFTLARQKSLQKNGIVLNAQTLEWASSSNMGMTLKYKFVYKGERKAGNNAIQKIRGLRVFENRSFPVFYDPELGQSQLLIDPEEFRRFNLPFPDSLSWVLKYFN